MAAQLVAAARHDLVGTLQAAPALRLTTTRTRPDVAVRPWGVSPVVSDRDLARWRVHRQLVCLGLPSWSELIARRPGSQVPGLGAELAYWSAAIRRDHGRLSGCGQRDHNWSVLE